MKKITIKKVSSSEANVSQRTVTYDVYAGETFLSHFKDIDDALAYKEELEHLRSLGEPRNA